MTAKPSPVAVLLVIGALALSVACKKKSKPEDNAQKPRSPATLEAPDEPFVFAAVERSPVPVPTRFAAELPTEVAAFAGDWSAYPPPSLVADLLCAGDAEMQAKLIRAAGIAAKTATADEVVGAYGGLLGYCSDPAFCSWAHQVVNSDQPLVVRSLLWHGLARCDDLKFAADFDRPEAPASAVISWTMAIAARAAPPFFARQVTAARETLKKGNAYEIRLAAVALGSTEAPAALLALFELHREATDQGHKDALAVGLHGFRDAAAREAFLDACTRSRDALCPDRRSDSATKEVPDASKEPLAALLDYRVEVGRVKQALAGREPELARALAGCVEKSLASKEASDWITYRCLSELEIADRKAAAVLARQIPVAAISFAPLREGVGGLLAFPTREAMQVKLRSLGLMPGGLPPSAADEPVLTLRDALEKAGRYHQFDTETGQFPNEHDHLLRTLAALAHPDLDGVVFEEIAPPFDEDAPQAGHYVLRAYAGGNRYSARAQNLGDWYDVEAVVGLLNILLHDKKSQMRLAVLPTGDQSSAILAGPKAGLVTAASQGLIEIGEEGAAADVGKAFEEKVLDGLREEAARPQLRQ